MTPSSAPPALGVPLAKITQALRVEEDGLAFFVIVQGIPGAHMVKVLRRDSRQNMASAIFHELMNGYSVVFSAAICWSEATQVGGQTLLWQ